jgi:hypothetical protein
MGCIRLGASLHAGGTANLRSRFGHFGHVLFVAFHVLFVTFFEKEKMYKDAASEPMRHIAAMFLS